MEVAEPKPRKLVHAEARPTTVNPQDIIRRIQSGPNITDGKTQHGAICIE